MGSFGQVDLEELVPWIIGIFAVIAVLVLLGILTGKGGSAIELFKNIWRFGR